MRSIAPAVILFFAFLVPGIAAAITVQETPFEITGFMDVLFTTDESVAGERDWRLGQAELDFFACTSSHSCACVAVAYDPQSAAFGLGAATIEFLIAGKGSDCRHHYDKWERSGLVVGKLDVPFGIDWLVYPSVDRRTITSPDAIGATHAGWNELGASFFIEASRYTLRAWLTNGFDAELVIDEETHHHLATESAVGVRASVMPAAGVELGASAAGFTTPDEAQEMSLLGIDAQGTRGPWAVKAEYISHHLDFGAPGDFTNSGWYAQGTREFAGWYAFTRYDNVDYAAGSASPDALDLEAVSFGVGLSVAAPAEFRLEYRAALDDAHDDLWQAQLVAGF